MLIGEGTVVEPGAMIKGPAIIGKNCQIRHNAYLRENVIIGDGCVVGNSSELKNALLFNGAQAPHYNYVGDSILGHKAHLGAGVKISNLKMFPGNIEVEVDGVPFDTGLRKFGALLGDGAEAGCNAVLNPGSILGRGAVVYPNVFWRGILPANMIAKNKAEIEVVIKRPREINRFSGDSSGGLRAEEKRLACGFAHCHKAGREKKIMAKPTCLAGSACCAKYATSSYRGWESSPFRVTVTCQSALRVLRQAV